MTAAAEGGAVVKRKFPTISRLKYFEVVFVVAIETVVVPLVRAVMHHYVRMFFGNDEILVFVKTQSGRLTFFMAYIAIEVRQIFASFDQVGIRPTRGHGAEKVGVHQWNGAGWSGPAPKVGNKRNTQKHEGQRQDPQADTCLGLSVHNVLPIVPPVDDHR